MKVIKRWLNSDYRTVMPIASSLPPKDCKDFVLEIDGKYKAIENFIIPNLPKSDIAGRAITIREAVDNFLWGCINMSPIEFKWEYAVLWYTDQ